MPLALLNQHPPTAPYRRAAAAGLWMELCDWLLAVGRLFLGLQVGLLPPFGRHWWRAAGGMFVLHQRSAGRCVHGPWTGGRFQWLPVAVRSGLLSGRGGMLTLPDWDVFIGGRRGPSAHTDKRCVRTCLHTHRDAPSRLNQQAHSKRMLLWFTHVDSLRGFFPVIRSLIFRPIVV